MTEPYQTEEYWDRRTRAGKAASNEADVIFEDPRFAIMTERAMGILKALIRPNWSVLDACCGYGRFAPAVNPKQYTGLDFSQEMIDWAKEKNPSYTFKKGSIHDHKDKYDCVFEVNSAKCMTGSNYKRDEVERILMERSNKCIMIIEVDYVYIRFTPNSHL